MTEPPMISQGAMAAVTILRELENVGISATLRCEPTERLAETRWYIHARSVGAVHHLGMSFTEAEVLAEGDWTRFAGHAVGEIQGGIRGMMRASTDGEAHENHR